MKISNIDIDAALDNVRQQLKDDPAVSQQPQQQQATVAGPEPAQDAPKHR
jgi:hypothetical protein